MDVAKLDWALLRTFIAAIDAGSILGAAKRLASYQPTISRQIGELEAQLGVPLFERTGRGLVPTRAGLAIVEPARAMAASAAAVEAALRGLGESLGGTVRVGCSQVVASCVLPPCVAGIRRAHPGIRIDVVSSNSLSNLLRRECDIAVRMVQPIQSTIVTRRVAELQMGAYAARDYLAQRPAPKRATDLTAHDLVGLDTDDSLVRALVAAGVPVTRDSFAVRCDDQVACIRLVEAGAGIGFMPRVVARTLPGLEPVLPRFPMPALPVWLAVHREIKGNPLIRTVFDALAEALPASCRIEADHAFRG
jgi:DNA-binding transcriptional LysR family regulator